jgi:hypothetical protein
MNMEIRLNILFISLLIGFAYPCSCMEPPPPEDAYEEADVVFSGEVTNMVINEEGYYYEVTFQIIDIWKGESLEEIIVLTELFSDTCGYPFQINNEYLVYAYTYSWGIYTNICTRTNLLEYASEDLEFLNSFDNPICLGDINDDGSINILDVILLVNFILGSDSPTDAESIASDLNGDNTINILDVVQVVNIILEIEEISIYSSNPDMNGQFFDAVLINRNPDCRAYTMDANNGNYGSSQITDISNGINDAVSNVFMDLVIVSHWNSSEFDYDSVTVLSDPELATHCRIISNMIPNHNFGVEVTGPNGDGWIHAIDHSDIEVTYISVNPIKTNVSTDTPRNPPIYDFEGILLNGVGISMDSGFCYNPGVVTGPNHLQSNEAGNTSGCGPQNSWFELPAYTIWNPEAEYMAGIFDSYFGHGYEGTYHYHALTHPLQEDSDQSQPPYNGDGSPVIGFAADGFPIYGHWFIDSNNQLVRAESSYKTFNSNSRTPIETALHGTPPTPWDIENNPDDFESDFGLEMGRYEEDWYFAGTGNLDVCNGAYDLNGDYGYYITDKYPFTPPCTFGARDPSFSKESPTLP